MQTSWVHTRRRKESIIKNTKAFSEYLRTFRVVEDEEVLERFFLIHKGSYHIPTILVEKIQFFITRTKFNEKVLMQTYSVAMGGVASSAVADSYICILYDHDDESHKEQGDVW